MLSSDQTIHSSNNSQDSIGYTWENSSSSCISNKITSANDITLSPDMLQAPAPLLDTPRRRLLDYTKCRGVDVVTITAPSTPIHIHPRPSLKRLPSGSPSVIFAPLSEQLSMIRSKSCESGLNGEGSMGSITSAINEEWSDQVEFLLKVPSSRRKRNSLDGEDMQSSQVQELRDSLRRRKPTLLRKSILKQENLELEICQGSFANSDERAQVVCDETPRRHSDENIFGKRRRARPSIIQREIESIISSDDGESLGGGGDDEWSMFSASTPILRASSLEVLFKELQLETARKADFMKSSTQRSPGAASAVAVSPRSNKDSSSAA